jgi:hypothetical protein
MILESLDGQQKEHVVLFHTTHHNPLQPHEAILDSQRLAVPHWAILVEEYRVSVLQVLTVFLLLVKVVYLCPTATA